MPRCYLIAVCAGSSVDQQSNNATLFNLVEQINVPPNAPPPPGNVIPLEIHVYWQFDGPEVGQDFEMRLVMVAKSSTLETSGDAIAHRALSPRLRTRLIGLPFPPVAGSYELCVDWRRAGEEQWRRQDLRWPVTISNDLPSPRVTH